MVLQQLKLNYSSASNFHYFRSVLLHPQVLSNKKVYPLTALKYITLKLQILDGYEHLTIELLKGEAPDE